jgi:hypothetical protein
MKTDLLLKLVKGIDDHLFNKLKPLVTVYSYDGKINLNTAAKGVYKALYRDFSDDDVKRILEERDRRGGWATVQSFVDYVSNDLNRTSFKSFYNNEKEYPFTVGSSSFLIESLGQINRSKSTIQKVIRIGVALTQNRGGQVTNEANPTTCNGPPPEERTFPTFWDARANQCKTKPRNQNECVNVVLGTWMEDTPGSGAFGCRILNNAPMPSRFLYPPKAGGGAGEPNAMKILYWSET